MKNANDITCTKNKDIVKPLLRWLLSLYTLIYLSEKIRFIKSLNRFSETDLLKAIMINDNRNKKVAQSLFSVILG
jgi:hypothetical protein